jgi:hypothetical protein
MKVMPFSLILMLGVSVSLVSKQVHGDPPPAAAAPLIQAPVDPPQVSVRLEVFEIAEEKMRAIEALVGPATKTAVELTQGLTVQAPSGAKIISDQTVGKSVAFIDDNGLFEKLFQRLRHDGTMDIISRPTLRSSSGQQAEIFVGTEFVKSDGKSPAQFVSGLRLLSTATVLPTGRTRIDVQFERKFGPVSDQEDIQLKTTVDLKSDQTAIFKGPSSTHNGVSRCVLISLTAERVDALPQRPTDQPPRGI